MFFMCHNKLKWKQDCVWCQHKRMSNADVRSIFLFFFFLFFIILYLNCCLWLRPSWGNVRKNLLFLCFLTSGSHNEQCGKYKLFHCTRSSIFLLLFHVQKNVLSVGVTRNRCRIKNLEERERDFCFFLLFFFFYSPLYTIILQDKCYVNTQRDLYSGSNCWFSQHKQNHQVLIFNFQSFRWITSEWEGKFSRSLVSLGEQTVTCNPDKPPKTHRGLKRSSQLLTSFWRRVYDTQHCGGEERRGDQWKPAAPLPLIIKYSLKEQFDIFGGGKICSWGYKSAYSSKILIVSFKEFIF